MVDPVICQDTITNSDGISTKTGNEHPKCTPLQFTESSIVDQEPYILIEIESPIVGNLLPEEDAMDIPQKNCVFPKTNFVKIFDCLDKKVSIYILSPILPSISRFTIATLHHYLNEGEVEIKK